MKAMRTWFLVRKAVSEANSAMAQGNSITLEITSGSAFACGFGYYLVNVWAAERQKRLSQGNTQIRMPGERFFNKLTGAIRVKYQRPGWRGDGIVINRQIVGRSGHRTGRVHKLHSGLAAPGGPQITQEKLFHALVRLAIACNQRHAKRSLAQFADVLGIERRDRLPDADQSL